MNFYFVHLSSACTYADLPQPLQVQERMTQEIADTLNDVLDPKGVAVVVEGQHMCMHM
jgi:GTP cyclohydrolase I